MGEGFLNRHLTLTVGFGVKNIPRNGGIKPEFAAECGIEKAVFHSPSFPLLRVQLADL